MQYIMMSEFYQVIYFIFAESNLVTSTICLYNFFIFICEHTHSLEFCVVFIIHHENIFKFL